MTLWPYKVTTESNVGRGEGSPMCHLHHGEHSLHRRSGVGDPSFRLQEISGCTVEAGHSSIAAVPHCHFFLKNLVCSKLTILYDIRTRESIGFLSGGSVAKPVYLSLLGFFLRPELRSDA